MAQHAYGIDIGTSNFKLFSVANKKNDKRKKRYRNKE